MMDNSDLKLDPARSLQMQKFRDALDLQRRKDNSILKTKIKQKMDEEFFSTKLGLRLHPLGPDLSNKKLLTKQMILQLSQNMRKTMQTPAVLRLKFQNRPSMHNADHEYRLRQALKKFKRKLHDKKHHLDLLALQQHDQDKRRALDQKPHAYHP